MTCRGFKIFCYNPSIAISDYIIVIARIKCNQHICTLYLHITSSLTWLIRGYFTQSRFQSLYLNVQVNANIPSQEQSHEHFALLQSVVHVPQSTCHCLIILTVEIWRRDYILLCLWCKKYTIHIQLTENNPPTMLFVRAVEHPHTSITYYNIIDTIRTYPEISSLSSQSCIISAR